MATFVANDEYDTGNSEVLFLAAFDERNALIGYLALRKHLVRVLGVPCKRVGVLVYHDTDRPHVIARPEDERRCAAAFYRHLLENERGWSLLELEMQDAESPLAELPPRHALRYYARHFETMPNTTLPLPFKSLGDYLHSVSGHQRRNLARSCRRLRSAGAVEFISSNDPAARTPLLDLYLDLERRSWKWHADAGIQRSQRRLEFFRALCEPSQPFRIGVDLVLCDGLPIAGTVTGVFDNVMHGLETAFDQDYVEYGPGHLNLLMAIGRAIETGCRAYNLNGNYAYYKARLGGIVTRTSAVQVYRVGRTPWLRARAGELWRSIHHMAPDKLDHNPDRRNASPRENSEKSPDNAHGPGTTRPARTAEREHAKRILNDLQERAVDIHRLSGKGLEMALPITGEQGRMIATPAP